MTNGGTINFGTLSEGLYNDGASTGSVSITFESITPPPPDITPPTVSTEPATSVGKTRATLEGILENDGYNKGDEPCLYRFSYWEVGTPSHLRITTSWEGSIYEGNTFSTSVSGLTPNTSYYFIAKARNSTGESSGDTESFRTLLPGSVDPNEPSTELKNLLTIAHNEGNSSRTWRLALKDDAVNGLDEHDQLSGSETGPRIVSIISEGETMYELN